MASLIRSTTAGSEWTKNELIAYKIIVTDQNVATFFGNPILPQPSVHQAILDNEEYPPDGIADRDDRKFFCYLDAVMKVTPKEESAVDDFAAHLLMLLGYEVPDRFIRQRKDIPLSMCGGHTHAKTDVCIVSQHQEGFLLLVQEDKRLLLEGVNPEPQLIAEAIAAFQYNNNCLRSTGASPIQAKTFPAITMIGTTPTFYKIPITQDLSNAVETGQCPKQPTIVQKLRPPVANREGGMVPLNDCHIILQCFEAFKQFV